MKLNFKITDYKKKYNDALERARDLMSNQNSSDLDKHLIEKIFPELKDDDDDDNSCIKKVLIDYFQKYKEQEDCGIKTFYGIPTDDILAWLEKQSTPKDIDMPGLKTSDLKPGTWIVHNTLGTCKIVCLNVTIFGSGYEVVSCNDGIKHFIGFDEESDSCSLSNCHLWTINDAKDGDVLVDSYSKDSIIILYKGIDKERNILAHCGWNGYNFSIKTNGLGYGGLDNTNYLPATKEQRDLLFEKMKNTGYEWDAENVDPDFKVKYAGSEYNVLEIKKSAGVIYYGIEDEHNHIDYIKADNCEIINGGYGVKEDGFSFPTKPVMFSEKK